MPLVVTIFHQHVLSQHCSELVSLLDHLLKHTNQRSSKLVKQHNKGGRKSSMVGIISTITKEGKWQRQEQHLEIYNLQSH